MTSKIAGRLATPAWIALVLAIAVASLSGVRENGFVWDDEPFIVRNASLTAPGTLQRILTAGDSFGTGWANPYYRPVTTLSFMIDRRLFGLDPAGYHATNLLLHLAVCALVFLAALKHTGRRFAAGAAALLFAVHPAVVEPVAFISARADLLCAAFMLVAWLLYLRGRETDSTRVLGVAALAFGLALFAKIVALALLPVLIMREILFVRREGRRFRLLVPFAAVAALFLLARLLVLEKTTWEFGVPFMMRLATAGVLLLEYLKNTLLPFNLKIYYDVRLHTTWADPTVFGAWAALAGCAVAWLLLLRRRPVIALGIAWFFVALLPVSGVVDLLSPALMADRYLYIPLVGAAIAVAGTMPDAGSWNLQGMTARRRVEVAAGCAALVACVSAFAVTSARQVPVWRDSLTLWEEARRGAPASPYVLNALGWVYLNLDRFDVARKALSLAATLAPDFAEPRVNLAAAAFIAQDFAAAATYTEEVLRIDPNHAIALRYRGALYEQEGDLDGAVRSLRAAVAANPFDEVNRGYLDDLVAAQSGR